MLTHVFIISYLGCSNALFTDDREQWQTTVLLSKSQNVWQAVLQVRFHKLLGKIFKWSFTNTVLLTLHQQYKLQVFQACMSVDTPVPQAFKQKLF